MDLTQSHHLYVVGPGPTRIEAPLETDSWSRTIVHAKTLRESLFEGAARSARTWTQPPGNDEAF